MEPLTNLLKQIYSPERLPPALKVLNQVTIPKLNNEIILLLRNVVRINNKVIHQFDGLAIAVKIIGQSLNLNYTLAEWSSIGENFSGLIIAMFESFLIYRNTSIMKDIKFCNLIVEAAKSSLPIVDKVDCLRVSVNNNGYSSILQIICLDDLDFPVRKEIFLLFKPIIVKSDTRQRKNIMNSNEFFLSKMAAMVLNCGDFETQEAIVEVLMRFSYSSKQKLNKILFWFREYPAVLTATKLLDYKSFDISCRKFLNSVNRNINSNVVTLSCFEACANEIKLQKPRSEEYEELWVDFSLNTGIIHIVCDSGANAWLRLFIDHKNVKNSSFSSRFLKKNDTDLKGKQILLELISPLEIEHHLKEALILTVTLVFVESSELDNLQENFFNKWYHQLKKVEKTNSFVAVKKTFQENIHNRCKQKEKFFNGTSISSLSSIHSCSTCSFHQCCHHKGKSRSPLSFRSKAFSTSTPKDYIKCESEQSPRTNLATTYRIGNFCSGPSKHGNLNSMTNTSGGIFNHDTQQKFQEATAKSSLVKGIFVGDNKKEDGLFKKMMEESSKKEKDKQINNSNHSDVAKDSNDNKPIFSARAQTPVVLGSNFDLKKDAQPAHKPLKLKISKNVSTEEDNALKKESINHYDKINNYDYSEESVFVMASHGNKHNILNINKETREINNSSLSQINTLDETSTKSSRKGISLLNPEEKNIKFQQTTEKITTPENNLKTEFQGNITYQWNNSPITKKMLPHSPYLKLFNTSISSQSGQIQQDDPAINPGKGILKNTVSNNSVFKLKPSNLQVGSLFNNELTRVSQNSFSFSTFDKVNKFLNANKDLTNALKSKSDRENNDFAELKNKTLNISQSNGKENHLTEIENTVMKRTIETETNSKIIVISEDEVNVPNFKETNEINFGNNDNSRQCNSLNDSNIIGEKTNKDKYKNMEKLDISKPNHSFLTGSNQINTVKRGDSDQELLAQASNSDDFQKKISPLHSILHNDEEINKKTDKNDTRKKKKVLAKKRNSKGSTGTWDGISSGQNTTISSLPSIHCLAIPQKTYSTKPTVVRKPTSPEQTFEDLIKQKGRNNNGNEINQKRTRSGRKRKLFTPNSSLEDMSPFKPGEDSVRPSEILFQDNPPAKVYKRKPKQNSNTVDENKKQKRTSQYPESSANIYNFVESSPSSIKEKQNGKITQRRKSLRLRAKKQYKELSSDESNVFQEEISPPKKKNSLKQKTSPTPTTFTLPEARLSISEKVSRFVWSMNEGQEQADVVRQEDLESEMRLFEEPVEENKSNVSQLESVEPPIWLSPSEAGILSPQGSSDSSSAPTELIIKGDSTRSNGKEEIEFIESIIKNIECLSISVKRRNPKIKSQERIVKTIESFTSSEIEEMNKKWKEAKQSLQTMISNLDNMSDSFKAYMASVETRMKDMIESSISEFNMDRSNSNSRSENICKELRKMCHERHKLLRKQ
ncbi:homeobox-like protein HDP1 isoform X2 [Halyomorpha halys]|uniref:homeobox-like protein HDP1 isoform X2 n=1 Tax=Halyomorpha halys TaxID=286706 RepID=UPI0006D50F1F|nr:uncharacterized protein LOC106677911 isoform X2 [Halyomorpha halys]